MTFNAPALLSDGYEPMPRPLHADEGVVDPWAICPTCGDHLALCPEAKRRWKWIDKYAEAVLS